MLTNSPRLENLLSLSTEYFARNGRATRETIAQKAGDKLERLEKVLRTTDDEDHKAAERFALRRTRRRKASKTGAKRAGLGDCLPFDEETAAIIAKLDKEAEDARNAAAAATDAERRANAPRRQRKPLPMDPDSIAIRNYLKSNPARRY